MYAPIFVGTKQPDKSIYQQIKVCLSEAILKLYGRLNSGLFDFFNHIIGNSFAGNPATPEMARDTKTKTLMTAYWQFWRNTTVGSADAALNYAQFVN
jgi:hypothetical protein